MVTDVIVMVLEGFHKKIVRLISGMTESKGDNREWEWALVDAALEVTGIRPIR